MRCTSIEKNKCGKCINQKLTENCVRLVLSLLHIDVVHPTFGEGGGFLRRTSIAISILCFRTFSGIMSVLLALETGNVVQIPLGWCCGVGTVLTAASSIPNAILGATVVVRYCSIVRMSSMVMASMVVVMSSRVRE